MRAPAHPYASTAATMISSPTRRTTTLPPPPPPVYYDLEEPIHRRPVWPWVAAVLFVIAAAVGGRPLPEGAGARRAAEDQERRLRAGREPPFEPHDRCRSRLPPEPCGRQ